MLVKEKLEQRQSFTEVESRIADYILERGEALAEDSVRQLAGQLYVSPSSVIRFCNKLGYDGFNSLKEDYLREVRYLHAHFQSIDPNFPFEKGDRENTLATKMAALYQEIIWDCTALLEPTALRQAVRLLTAAKTICVCAAGIQQGAARMFRDRMVTIGYQVELCTEMDMTYYRASYCTEDTCFLIISYTGENQFGLMAAKKMKERGIPAIAITAFGQNSLADLCCCRLNLATREQLANNLGYFGVSLSAMYLLDTLYVCCFNGDYDRHLADKLRYSRECEEGRHSDNAILQGKKL